MFWLPDQVFKLYHPMASSDVLQGELINLQQCTGFLEQYKSQFLLSYTPDIIPQLWDMLYLFDNNVKDLELLNKLVDSLPKEDKTKDNEFISFILVTVMLILVLYNC